MTIASRFLWILFAGAAALCAQESLEVAAGLRGMVDRHLTVTAKQLLEARAARVAAIRTPEQAAERQRYIRSRMLEEIGGFPEKTPLNARVTGILKRQGYRIEKLIYESQPRYFITANLYVPETGTGPFPAVLGTAGHSTGGKAYSLYQRAWIGLVKRGFVVLAYDPPGQGERSEYWDPETGRSRVGIGVPEHIMAGLQCLLTGTNIARYEIWDGVRAVDYLLTRKEVDPKRVAAIGNSGGGTQSAYLAALEPRLAAAVPSCYITSWSRLWENPGPQDSEQVFAGFLSDGFDFPDFLTAYAPRPTKMLTAIRDFFPIEGGRAAFAEARRFFEVLGKPEHVGYFEYDDPHGWSKPRREATYRWLEKWLNGREDEGVEPEFPTEPERELHCTPTGQVATSLKGETTQSLNRALAERLYPGRAAATVQDPAALRALIAETLQVPGTRGVPRAERHGEIGREGYRIEKIVLTPEAGISLPALALIPAAGAARKPAVLYVNSAGKAADAGRGQALEALALAGNLVLALDPRGWGESGAPGGRSGYSGTYQTAMRAILVGKTLSGMQVADVLRGFDYLASRPDVDPARISLHGKGNGGVLALYAAALEPRIGQVKVENAPLSFMDIVRARIHENTVDLAVPGVLRKFDLPDLTRAIAPRSLEILDPRAPAGGPVLPEAAKAAFPSARVAMQ